MNVVDQLGKLLLSDSIEKQIAAALVIGELRVKGPAVASALETTLESDVPLLQRHALVALARTGAKRALPKIFPLLLASDQDVRRAATQAVASVGQEVVPLLRKRLITASPEEKRALDAVLAELGGKDAFSALLSNLGSRDEEAARASAVAVRQRVKDADGNEKRSYLTQVERFLSEKKKERGEGAVAAAIKILGYLEDERTVPTLLSFVKNKKEPLLVRQEAMIALRFALGAKKNAPKVVDALLDVAGETDRGLATTALHTLGTLEVPATMMKRLENLVAHPDGGRSRFVIEHLGRQKDEGSAKLLSRVVTTADKDRSTAALQALQGNDAAVSVLARSLLDVKDIDRAWAIGNFLRPSAKKVSKAVREELLAIALGRLAKGERGWEPLLDVARGGDADRVVDALRELAKKLKKSNPDKAETVFSILCRSDRAGGEDRYELASLLLRKSRRDTRKEIRASDESLRQLTMLARKGFDVGSALRKDRALGLEEMFYVGFHFSEESIPFGRDLLEEVAKKGGRSKIGKMAKNKLEITS